MKDQNLTILPDGGGYAVRVRGRANFEYAVPLRDLINRGAEFDRFRIDLGECLAMDSTFMGVLTMIALRGRRSNVRIELLNASETLQKLLRDLGVAKLFDFTTGAVSGEAAPNAAAGALETAETVAEAHETLVAADGANADRFASVIEYARRDVENLKEPSQNRKD